VRCERAGYAILLLVSNGCAPTTQNRTVVDMANFCEARDELHALEDRLAKPRNQRVSLALSAPYIPTKVNARGAVAMAPPGDLRMILTGPGGVTAMDLWMHGGHFRFAIPAMERTIRGDASTPPEKKRGLPVDFLRWWLLDPLAGDLLWAARDDEGLHFVLRDRGAYVDATIAKDGHVKAKRTTWGSDDQPIDEETIDATSIGCGTVEYTQKSTELVVVATCENETNDVPATAFVDPDTLVAH
jgi:hypothetical protein